MRPFGHVRKRGNSYRAYWREYGKQKCKTFSTSEDAFDHLARMRLHQGQVDFAVTYNQYYTGVLKPSIKDLSPRTKADYEYYWNKMKPFIGRIKISSTDWRLIQNTIDNFDNPEAQRKIFNIWKKMLNFAVRDGLLLKNPCNDQIQRKQIIRKPKKIWNKEELCEMLIKLDGTRYALPVLLECCCGLRHEEFCGINTPDINFDNGWPIISINKAVTSVNGKKVIKDTKTLTSTREVVLHKRFTDYLNANTQGLQYKRSLQDYPHPQSLTKSFRLYCKRNNLDFIPFGNMRTVYATLSAEAGCVDSIVSMSMGHAGNNIKQKNYQKMTIKALKMNATAFVEYLDFNYVLKEKPENKRKKTNKENQ